MKNIFSKWGQKWEQMQDDKKKIFIIVVSILVIAIISAGTALIIKNIVDSNNKNTVTVSKSSADKLKTQAIEASKNNDLTKAKKLFEQAKSQYTELKDTTAAIDMDAQIYIIDHTKK